MSKRQETIQKKLAVLEIIKLKKDLLFGSFSSTLTQKEKEKEWSEVLVKAQSLQLAGTDKKWMFARDQLWGLWKCRALAKRDNAKKTGSGGGKDKVFDEVDLAIFEILKSNVVVLDGLGLPENQSEDIKITELVLEPGNSDPQCSLNSPSDNYNRKIKFISLSEKKKEKVSVSAEREALKIKLLETELYYKKLKCLELEKKLGLPPSNITDHIIQEKLFTIDVSTDFVCEMLN